MNTISVLTLNGGSWCRLNMLGQTNRHDKGDELAPHSQLRVMTSLTTLLKCRSIQILGVQLLLTIMLIAHSTRKQ